MPHLSPIQIAFLAANALLGLVVGLIAAGVPAFATLGIPPFLWLIAGLFITEMLAGMLMKVHPTAIIAMPLRVAALALSFLACYGALTVLGGAA